MADQEQQLVVLRDLRERTLADIAHLQEQLQEEIEPASATDDDAADVAADIYERGKIISLIQNMQMKLHSIDHAMQVTEEGRYGVCEKCGCTIPAERLEIMPETTLCVQCASQLEHGIRRHQLLQDMQTANLRARYTEDEEEEDPEEDD
ncbi:MAG: TraR/DksA C4-type zinc finger protein [Chloroflexota bacterium]